MVQSSIDLKRLLYQFLILFMGLGFFGLGFLGQGSFASNTSLSNEELITNLRVSNTTAYGPDKGFTVTMRLQEPGLSLSEYSDVSLTDEEVFFARNDVLDGPSDSQFIYGDSSREARVIGGDSSFYTEYDHRLTTADSGSVYANNRVTSDLFQMDLIHLLSTKSDDLKLRNAAQSYLTNTVIKPLFYYVKGEEMENAYYSRFPYEGQEYRIMVLGYYWDQNSSKYQYTGKQPDIVWHEMGHAIVDATREDLFNNSAAAGAFHEAWGDTNAMFTLLSRSSVPTALMYQTRGDMKQDNFLAHVAEQFGASVLNTNDGLRDLDDDLSALTAGGVHSRSRVLSGAIYDIMVSAHDDLKRTGRMMPDVALSKVGDFLRQHWVYTLTQVDSSPSFTNVGMILKDTLPNRDETLGYGLPWKNYVEEAFNSRGITLDDTPDPFSWTTPAGTLLTCHKGVADQSCKRNQKILESTLANGKQ